MARPVLSAHAVLAVLVAVVVGASAGAQDGGVPVYGGDVPCESCRAGRTPPWHGSVAASRGVPAMPGYGHGVGAGHCPDGRCGPAGRACGPACRSCGPVCRSCGLSGVCGLTGACHAPLPCWGYPYPLPPCLPRLHSWLREGVLLSPQPLVTPRCHHCGAFIEGGF